MFKRITSFFFFFFVGSYIIYCTGCIQLSVTTDLRVIFTHSATFGLIILLSLCASKSALGHVCRTGQAVFCKVPAR